MPVPAPHSLLEPWRFVRPGLEGDHARKTIVTWTYDGLNRLVKEDYDSYDAGVDYTTRYTVDLVGNRLTKVTDKGRNGSTDKTITYTYDANDRLLTEVKDIAGTPTGDTYTAYGYSAAGAGTEQTSKTVSDGLTSGGTLLSQTTYEYDLQGRLSRVRIDANGDNGFEQTLEYAYDDAGVRVEQRVTKNSVTTTTRFLVDTQNLTGYTQVLEEKDGSGNVTRTYTLGLDVIAQQSPSQASGGTLTFLYDGHGSTRALLDALGAATERYAYDAFGVQLEGVGLTSASAALTTILYAGESIDYRTGLSYNRARYYRPGTGTFLSLDPFAGNTADPQSLHKYLYAHANPVVFTDPTGWCTPQQFGTWATYEVGAYYAAAHLGDILSIRINRTIPGSTTALRPDIANYAKSEVAEIKPATGYGFRTGRRDLAKYLVELPIATKRPWTASTWGPSFLPIVTPLCPRHFGLTIGNVGGVIYYVRLRLPPTHKSVADYAAEFSKRMLDEMAGHAALLAQTAGSTADSAIGIASAIAADVSERVNALGDVAFSQGRASSIGTAQMNGLYLMLGIAILLALAGRGATA